MNAKHTSTDVNHADGSIVNWFVLNGTDSGTEINFNNETFGVVNCAGQKSVVDSDGATIANEYVSAIVLRTCKSN